jgi:integrase/recombinase XerD
VKRKNPLPTVLDRHEQYALLDQPNLRYPTEQRNLLFLRLQLDNGLRLPEMRSLRWKHINLSSGKLRVEGVEVHDRMLWLASEDLSLVRDWRDRQKEELAKRQLQGSDLPAEQWVFANLDGSKMSRKYFRRMVRENARRAGLHKTVLPYTLRHTFATDLYLESGNLRLVQKALGLSDLSSTVIYRRLARRKLNRALSNLPGARKISGRDDIHRKADVRFTRMAVRSETGDRASEREIQRT